MTQDFKKKLCDAGCTRHGTGECGYDTRGIEQNCPYFNYILSGYELMERELQAWANGRMKRLNALFRIAPSSAMAGKYDAMKELIEKIESL